VGGLTYSLRSLDRRSEKPKRKVSELLEGSILRSARSKNSEKRGGGEGRRGNFRRKDDLTSGKEAGEGRKVGSKLR